MRNFELRQTIAAVIAAGVILALAGCGTTQQDRCAFYRVQSAAALQEMDLAEPGSDTWNTARRLHTQMTGAAAVACQGSPEELAPAH